MSGTCLSPCAFGRSRSALRVGLLAAGLTLGFGAMAGTTENDAKIVDARRSAVSDPSGAKTVAQPAGNEASAPQPAQQGVVNPELAAKIKDIAAARAAAAGEDSK